MVKNDAGFDSGFYVFPYGVFDGDLNMAIDWVIFTNRLRGWRFYRWSKPTLSFGKLQKVENSKTLWKKLKENGIDLVRRPTGGRAVLHHNELTYLVVDEVGKSLMADYFKVAEILIEVLKRKNPAVEVERRSRGTDKFCCFDAPSWGEIKVNGKKVVGSAQYRKSGYFLQHGSIVIKPSEFEELVFGKKSQGMDGWLNGTPEGLAKEFEEYLISIGGVVIEEDDPLWQEVLEKAFEVREKFAVHI